VHRAQKGLNPNIILFYSKSTDIRSIKILSVPAEDLYLTMKLVFKGVNANKNGRIIQENRPDDQDAHCHHCVNLKSYNFWFIKMCHVFLSQLKELFAESKNEFCCLVAHLAIQHPGCREHQRNVACHIDHGCPVNGSAANLVIPHHDICDN